MSILFFFGFISEMAQEAVNITSDHQHTIFENHWFRGYYGWMLYNVVLMIYTRKQFDLDNDGYGFSELMAFFRYHNISIIFALLMVPILVMEAPWLLSLINLYWDLNLPFHDGYYYGVGPFCALLQLGIHKIAKLNDK